MNTTADSVLTVSLLSLLVDNHRLIVSSCAAEREARSLFSVLVVAVV